MHQTPPHRGYVSSIFALGWVWETGSWYLCDSISSRVGNGACSFQDCFKMWTVSQAVLEGSVHFSFKVIRFIVITHFPVPPGFPKAMSWEMLAAFPTLCSWPWKFMSCSAYPEAEKGTSGLSSVLFPVCLWGPSPLHPPPVDDLWHVASSSTPVPLTVTLRRCCVLQPHSAHFSCHPALGECPLSLLAWLQARSPFSQTLRATLQQPLELHWLLSASSSSSGAAPLYPI